MAMSATGLGSGAIQELLAMGQQYAAVEQELRNLAEQLKETKQRKRQLAAEVKFLQAKLRSFQRIPDLDGPSQAAHDRKSVRKSALQRPFSKPVGPGNEKLYTLKQNLINSVEAPQFFEVEVKYADSLGSGMIDPMAVFEFPSNPRDPQNEFAPVRLQDRKSFWQDERHHS